MADRKFTVEDVRHIEIITIDQKGYPLIHLSKQKDHWLLNSRDKVDKIVINNLLTLFEKIHISYIPSKAAVSNIRRDTKKLGIQVKAYDKSGQELLSYIVGGNTNDEGGTYFMANEEAQPYVMALPMIEGGLRGYFSMTMTDFMDKAVFDIDPDNIVSITVDFRKDLKSSFRITKNGSSDIRVTPLHNILDRNIENTPATRNRAKAYVNAFRTLYAESIETENALKDSILQFVPFMHITVELREDRSLEMDFYPLLDLLDPEVNTKTLADLEKIERFYVHTNSNDFFLVQLRLMTPLLRNLQFFIYNE